MSYFFLPLGANELRRLDNLGKRVLGGRSLDSRYRHKDWQPAAGSFYRVR